MNLLKMNRIIGAAMLAAMLLASGPAQAQRKLNLPYETSTYGADKVTKNGVTATVVDRRKAAGYDHSGYVSIENTNDCPVRVSFQVYGVTTDGSRKLTTDKDVTVGAKKVHNEVCYYKEDSENTFKTFAISISVTKQKTMGTPADATVDNSPDKPIAVRTPKAPGSKGGSSSGISNRGHGSSSGIGKGKGASGSGIGKGGKLGNVPKVPGTSSSARGGSSPSRPGYGGEGGSESSGSGASNASYSYSSVLSALKGKPSQDDYAHAITLVSGYVEQVAHVIPEAARAEKNGDKETEKRIRNEHKDVFEKIGTLGALLEKADKANKLNSENHKNYKAIEQRVNQLWGISK